MVDRIRRVRLTTPETDHIRRSQRSRTTHTTLLDRFGLDDRRRT
jgi:hypothetical protein